MDVNLPGDEPALMTTLDGYPMAKQGKAATALALSAVASFVGATLATIGLTLFAPLLAQFAIHFGPAEYTALFVLAFTRSEEHPSELQSLMRISYAVFRL